MDFGWVAIALGDVAWIAVAFSLGLLARTAGLPPLVGFLAAGFILNGQGVAIGSTLEKLSDLGITLLLFTVGLKLNVRTLARPQVWAVAGLHAAVIVALFGMALYGAALWGLPLVSDVDLRGAVLIAFALSFSSTVFVVKVLEEKGEMKSLHGQIAIGILIMQDLAAVAFLAASSGKWPSFWALLVVLLVPLRMLLHRLLNRVGHGELLVLYGFLLALGGAKVFELVGLKGDLGALVLGVMIAPHARAEELAKTMLGFKDLFLLGFFLLIGLSGQLTPQSLLLGVLITPLILIKSALFMVLLTRFELRARTSLLASLNLTNFSEFGLIVAAISVANGWIGSQWVIIIAIGMSLSFAIASGLNAVSHQVYVRHRSFWRRFQTATRLVDDRLVDLDGATVVIVGMGGVGTGAYDHMSMLDGENVVGIDIDPVTVANQRAMNRNVLTGDPGDADFWDRVQKTHTLHLVMLALPRLGTSLSVIEELKGASFGGRIAAIARFPDEVEALEAMGVSTVFNIYTEAGAGFASHGIKQNPKGPLGT